MVSTLQRTTVPPSPRVRYLLVDDQPLSRAGLVSLLRHFADLQLVGVAATGSTAAAHAGRQQPQVVLLHLNLAGASGSAVVQAILAAAPGTAVCVLRDTAQVSDFLAMVAAGARGYLLKDVTVNALHRGIHALAGGGAVMAPAIATDLCEAFVRASWSPRTDGGPSVNQLTGREREVLGYLAAGWHNDEIADRLGIAVNTVKVHLRNVLSKLELKNRQHAAAYAVQVGLEGPPVPSWTGSARAGRAVVVPINRRTSGRYDHRSSGRRQASV